MVPTSSPRTPAPFTLLSTAASLQPPTRGHGALAMTWVPHMAALGWGLGYPQFCI